jgi:hypothetical protein
MRYFVSALVPAAVLTLVVGGCGGGAEQVHGSGSGGNGASAGVRGGPAGGSAGFGGTSGSGATSSGCLPTAASIHQTILLPNCTTTTCHGARAAATLDLTLSDWETRIVGASAATCDGVALVVPGSPEQSFLYQKVTEDMPACGGERMPVERKLALEDIQCIRDWITSLSATGCETCGGDECVSLPTDAMNCGRCGNVCPTGSSCQSGICACPVGQAACETECLDVTADPANCGGCGQVCPGGALCSAGQCECAGTLVACGAGCYDVSSDAAHCGNCATACSAGEVCLTGECSTGCGELTQCGTSCVDLDTSVANCGTCARACTAGLSCVGGECACPSGQMLCGASCVDVAADTNHCGACGTQCGPGSKCLGGECQCGTTTVSFMKDIQPVFTASCTSAGCHTGMRPKEGLSLDAGKAYAELVNVATSQCGGGRILVKAGDAGQSYLMQKLLGSDLCSGSQMPKAGQSIPSAELALISDWICQGATDN